VRPAPVAAGTRWGTLSAEVPVPIRVLVVDDQQLFRGAMTAVVDATDGFEVVGTAASGEQALTVGAALGPDLVLMDVNLPGIDGVEATRRLRASRPGLVVLLLSTYDALEGEALAAECGAVGYVTKSELAPDTLSAAWAASAA
jgi:DNA-binding NarL/FixJ family response regulator